jgi:uncharacterized protein (DUF58 family)
MPEGVLFDSEFLKKLEYLYIVAKKVITGRVKAERRSRKHGSSVEFADFRPYTPGDDFRYLDWNVYARLDELLLKLFEEEEDLHISVLIDVSRSMAYGEPPKLDYAKRVAAAIAYIGLSNLDRVAIVPFSDEPHDRLPMTRGKGKIFTFLEFLERLGSQGETRLERSFRTFVHQTKRRGVAVLISDLFDPDRFERGLNVIKYQKHELYVIHIIDEDEAAPDLLGDYRLEDMETGRVRQVTVSEQTLKRYRAAFEAYLNDIERYCRQREIGYIRTLTSFPFDELILKVFRSGGFLR